MTKAAFWLMPLLVLASIGQSPAAQSGQASSSGACSPAVTGKNNTFTITCTAALPPEQRQQIADMLTRLVAEGSSIQEILTKLDSCITEVAPRKISPDQRQRIIDALGNLPGAPVIRVKAPNATAESIRFADQLHEAFSSTPGWSAPPVSEDMIIGATPIGLVARVSNQRSIYGIAILRLFGKLKIPVEFTLDPTLSPETVVMIVGQKPVN